LGTGVAVRRLAFSTSVGNEQGGKSVVFNGLCRDRDRIFPFCCSGQQRALEPDAQNFRAVKTC
jgi:hypothetical protein